jgi:hypothetical protein
MLDNLQVRVLVVVLSLAGSVAYIWFAYRLLLRRRYGRVPDLLPKLIPVLITTLAAMSTVIALIFSGSENRREMIWWPFTTSHPSSQDQSAKIAELQAKVEELNRQLISLAATPRGQQQPTDAALAVIEKKLDSDSERISKFEQLFLSDAERLITVPLLQRDIKSIKDDLPTIREQVKGLSGLVTETSGQNRWVIGTLAFGMLALVLPAVRSLLTSGKPDETKSPPKV